MGQTVHSQRRIHAGSFDVSSLFTCTNVPLDETIEICLDKLYALPKPPRSPRLALKNLLLFATIEKKSHFVFDGQIDGVAMGSPLGLVLASIFMCDFEEKWVMKNINQPAIWFWYVDDTFTLFKTENDALSFLHYLNGRDSQLSLNKTMKFHSLISF